MGIKIAINEDGVWGDTSLDGIDTIASISNLERMVADAVTSEYGLPVEVSVEQSGRVKIDGMDDEDDVESIMDIIHDVWVSWEWVANS